MRNLIRETHQEMRKLLTEFLSGVAGQTNLNPRQWAGLLGVEEAGQWSTYEMLAQSELQQVTEINEPMEVSTPMILPGT